MSKSLKKIKLSKHTRFCLPIQPTNKKGLVYGMNLALYNACLIQLEYIVLVLIKYICLCMFSSRFEVNLSKVVSCYISRREDGMGLIEAGEAGHVPNFVNRPNICYTP